MIFFEVYLWCKQKGNMTQKQHIDNRSLTWFTIHSLAQSIHSCVFRWRQQTRPTDLNVGAWGICILFYRNLQKWQCDKVIHWQWLHVYNCVCDIITLQPYHWNEITSHFASSILLLLAPMWQTQEWY